MFLVFVEEVGHGEVVELQSYTCNDASLSPSQREFYLVVRLGHEVPVDVYRSVLIVRFGLGYHLFRIEVAHGCEFAL